MKIGFLGTHGVRKTTYALQTALQLKKHETKKSVGFLNEIVRECPFTINKDSSPEAQIWIYHKQILREIEMCRLYDFLICDRTILDGLVYAQYAGFKDIVDDYLNPALSWMSTYDRLYWLRPKGSRPVNDGFRDTDPVFQKDIDKIMSEWIKQFGIDVYPGSKNTSCRV